MNVSAVLAALEGRLTAQLLLADHDPSVEAASQVLLSSFEPALREASMALAEQAAAEVRAQLPDRQVDVMLSDGDPTIVIGDLARNDVSWSDLEARLTLRLPDDLKRTIELSAQDAGDSINAHVVKLLGRYPQRRRKGGSLSGTIET